MFRIQKLDDLSPELDEMLLGVRVIGGDDVYEHEKKAMRYEGN